MQRTQPEDSDVANILAPVRSDRDVRWISECLAKLHQREPIRVHVLSVQPAYDGHVRMFFHPEEIHAIQREDAEREMQPLCDALKKLGIPFNKHVAVGSSAEEIASFAESHYCRQIVMGPSLASRFTELVLGSLNHQVSALMRASGRSCEVI